MTLSKRQNGYLNQRVILFILQYETHSLQMHPKSPCRSIVAPTPKLSERQHALRLVVFSCQYFPVCRRLSNPFRHLGCPTSLLLSSRISSAAVSIHVVLYLRHHARPLLSSPLTMSAIPIILNLRHASIFILPPLCCGPHLIIFHCSVYFSVVVCLPSPIIYSP